MRLESMEILHFVEVTKFLDRFSLARFLNSSFFSIFFQVSLKSDLLEVINNRIQILHKINRRSESIGFHGLIAVIEYSIFRFFLALFGFLSFLINFTNISSAMSPEWPKLSFGVTQRLRSCI